MLAGSFGSSTPPRTVSTLLIFSRREAVAEQGQHFRLDVVRVDLAGGSDLPGHPDGHVA